MDRVTRWPRTAHGLVGVLAVLTAATCYFVRPMLDAWTRPVLTVAGYALLAAGAGLLALCVWPRRPQD